MTLRTPATARTRPARARLPIWAAVAGLAIAAATLVMPGARAQAGPVGARVGSAAGTGGMRRACAWPPAPGHASCLVLYQPAAGLPRRPAAARATRPSGLTPRQIESAYRLPVSRNPHQTVAVSIAYNTPGLGTYLAHYRHYFGLPPCTMASGCLRIVNQQGKTRPLPPSGAGSGWDLEATLDVSMISVACPHCKILVVEGNSTSTPSLAATERTAARLGAQVISNSYGQDEDGAALAYRAAYHQPGHTVVVSSGDGGFTNANFPADLTTVTAVGGTQLSRTHDNKRGWNERAWNAGGGAGGSGCSAYVAKPAWQRDPHCQGRTVADVSAVAWNVPIYNKAWGGWVTVGGTSVAAPLIAGIYGLAGNAARIPLGYAYSRARDLFDITRGNNSLSGPPQLACGDDYLCEAKKGYDAPTGLGTPDRLGAF